MSRTLLAFLLSELKTVRILCRGPKCRAALEVPLEDAGRQGLARCPSCGNDLDPLHTGAGPLAELSRAVAKLNGLAAVFEVEFVLPAEGH